MEIKNVLILTFCLMSHVAFSQFYTSEMMGYLDKISDTVNYSIIRGRDTDTASIASRKAYYAHIQGLKKYYFTTKNILKIGFGFNENASGLAENSKINTNIAYQYGSYPQKISSTADLSVEFRNGELDENISTIDIGYTQFIKKEIDFELTKDDFVFETNAFMKRTSNTYIGEDSRYEIGGGFILHLITTGFKRNGLVSGGRSRYDLLTRYSDTAKPEDNRVNESKHSELADAYSVLKDSTRSFSPLNLTEKKLLGDFNENLKISNILEQAKFEFTLGLGVYNETERITITDTLKFDPNDFQVTSKQLSATNTWRVFIRPVVRVRFSDELEIMGYGSIKFSPLEYRSTVMTPSGAAKADTSDLADYQLEFGCEARFKVNSRFSAVVQYRFVRKNAPRRLFELDNNGAPYLFQAADRHQLTIMKFEYTM